MMMDRREFFAGAALAAVAPALVLLRAPLPAATANGRRVVFVIDGWSAQENSETDEQVRIRVGHSWRTAWR